MFCVYIILMWQILCIVIRIELLDFKYFYMIIKSC